MEADISRNLGFSAVVGNKNGNFISHAAVGFSNTYFFNSHLFELNMSSPFLFSSTSHSLCPGGTVRKPHLPRAGGQLSGERGQPGGSLHQGTTHSRWKSGAPRGKAWRWFRGRAGSGLGGGLGVHGSVGTSCSCSGVKLLRLETCERDERRRRPVRCGIFHLFGLENFWIVASAWLQPLMQPRLRHGAKAQVGSGRSVSGEHARMPGLGRKREDFRNLKEFVVVVFF